MEEQGSGRQIEEERASRECKEPRRQVRTFFDTVVPLSTLWKLALLPWRTTRYSTRAMVLI
jgi:hypothetical protein